MGDKNSDDLSSNNDELMIDDLKKIVDGDDIAIDIHDALKKETMLGGKSDSTISNNNGNSNNYAHVSMQVVAQAEEEKKLSFFEKYLFVWVLICMGIGIGLSAAFPNAAKEIDSAKVGEVSIPIGICLFIMMYPALMNIKWSEVKNVVKHPLAVAITLISNWIIAPFLHWVMANAILKDYDPQLTVSIILLGSSPCTAMVLVWGYLAGGNQEQNIINTSINTLTLIILYAPIVALYTGAASIKVDIVTLFITAAVFILSPLVVAVISKYIIVRLKGEVWFKDVYMYFAHMLAIVALLVTLIVLFMLNGKTMISHPYELLLVSAPLLILYPIIILINAFFCKLFGFHYKEAAIIILIGSSSHFEIAIATAVGLYGVESLAALGTTMGLFWEVPLMLGLVYILRFLNRKNFFNGEPLSRCNCKCNSKRASET